MGHENGFEGVRMGAEKLAGVTVIVLIKDKGKLD